MAPERSWCRKNFTDHPRYDPKAPAVTRPLEVFANIVRKDKIKCYCSPCLVHDVGKIMEGEEADARFGMLILPRTYDEVVLSLFNIPAGDQHSWIESRTETLLVHLRDCTRQPAPDRERARNELRPYRRSGTDDTPRANRFYSSVPPSDAYAPIEAVPPIPFTIPNNPQNYSLYSAPSPNQQSDLFRTSHSPIPPPGAPPPLSPLYPMEFYSDVSRSSSPLGRAHGLPAHTMPFSKRQRSTSSKHSLSARSSMSDLNDMFWGDERQKQFEVSLTRLTASAGFSLSWVENPEFISLCQEFIPSAVLPSRKVLTQRILPEYISQIRKDVQAEASGGTATAQCDGWTGENSHHFLAFMMTSNRKLFTVQVNDTTTERKTAENLLALMIEVIEKLKNTWNVTVIAFTTDASGESRKARRLLAAKFPHIVVPDCYAHQINLIVGDYFKANGTVFLSSAAKANELITWLRSKTAVLGLIRQALISKGRQPLSVIRPVPTRWTAFYLAYRRLLDLRQTLEFIISEDALREPEKRMVIPASGNAQARLKAGAMVAVMKDASFWYGLVRIKHHLAPLAIAANVTQSTHCRLDEVLLTFGSLVMDFQTMTDAVDAPVQNALLKSVESRWSKSDQEPFIASVILNPFSKILPFKLNVRIFSMGALYGLMRRLWMRFFNTAVPESLYEELRDYLDGTGEYRDLKDVCSSLKGEAERKKTSPDPLRAYLDISVVGTEPTALIRLARHLLSICPNSASCERLFSTFGLILTKLRSRLGTQRLLDLAELKMHLRDEHLRNNTRQHLKNNFSKRQFGVVAEASIPQAPTGAGTPPVIPIATISSQNPDVEMTNNTEPQVPASLSREPVHASEPTSDFTPEPSSNSSTQSLQRITSSLIGMVTDDSDSDDDFEPVYQPSAQSITISLNDLFDFRATHWIATQRRGAVGSLEAELEFYDLLDLDGAGDADLDPDLDDCVATLFEN